MASCTSVFTDLLPTASVDTPAIERSGHLQSQCVGGVPRQLSQANLREASANPLRFWAVPTLRHVSNSNRLHLEQ
jgi:hypothetical protein